MTGCVDSHDMLPVGSYTCVACYSCVWLLSVLITLGPHAERIAGYVGKPG